MVHSPTGDFCGNPKKDHSTSNSDSTNFQKNAEKLVVSITKVPATAIEILLSEDYQLLPEKWFQLKDFHPPLVLKKWFEQLKETGDKKILLESDVDQESEDESISLLNLRFKLKNCSQFGVQKNSGFISRNKSALVQRKRGRPKKLKKSNLLCDFESSTLVNEGEISDDYIEDVVWNCNSNHYQNAPAKEEFQEKSKKENNFPSFNCYEHDYFKPVESIINVSGREDLNIKKKKNKTVHQTIESHDSKINFSCKDCGKTFSASSTLKHHLRIHNGTLLKCPECQKGFTTNYLLKCHMRIHNGDLFMCSKCGKGFITAELLKVHSRSHSGDRPFSCDICNKAFPSASNLSQHKQTHETEKKFLCFQCGSSFSQKRCLDGHMLTHSEKNHICTVCGKLWARKSDLSEHMRVHTGVKPYCCDMCPQKFTQASSLKRHKIVHLDVKPIQCPTCKKLFKCKQYYKRHVRKHEMTADNFSAIAL